MSKTNKNEELKQNKVMTKYDRKMQERKEKATKDKRSNAITKLVTAIIVVVLIAAIAISVVLTVNSKKKAISDTFMMVGEHEITSVEYDYYYNIMLTNHITTYSSFLPYMGYDASVDPDLQAYDETRTWGDYLDHITVEQIKETKAMVDDAKATGFVYETEDADYKTFIERFQMQADVQGLTLANYFKQSFGEYATQERLEPYIRETLLVGAYAGKLMEDYAPTDEEIAAHYDANKKNYDKVTYKLYTFSADDATAMADAEVKANEMKDACIAGEDFQALCDKYDDENSGENNNTVESATYSLTSSVYADWIYDDARVANDIEVFADETNNRYYVVQFVEKVSDMDTINATISNEIASERVIDYKAGLVKKYEIKDVAGELKYLTLPVPTAE